MTGSEPAWASMSFSSMVPSVEREESAVTMSSRLVSMSAAVVAIELVDALLDVRLACQDNADVLRQDEAQLVGGGGVYDRVGGEGDVMLADLDRHYHVGARHGCGDGGPHLDGDVRLGEVDDVGAHVAGEHAEEVVFGKIALLDDDIARRLAGVVVLLLNGESLLVVDDAVLDGDVEDWVEAQHWPLFGMDCGFFCHGLAYLKVTEIIPHQALRGKYGRISSNGTRS